MTDKDLIRGLLSEDKEVLRSIYILFFNSVRHLVVNNNGCLDDAKDVFQESILVLFQKCRKKEFKLTCTLRTYIYSVARNLWLKELNKRSKQRNGLIDIEEYSDVCNDIVEIYEKNERLSLYRDIFEKLSLQCKKILTLFNEGRSIKEVTTIMGFKNDQHTKNRRYRCKLSLINRIKNTYGFCELGYETDKTN